jgi:hypothetical protein
MIRIKRPLEPKCVIYQKILCFSKVFINYKYCIEFRSKNMTAENTYNCSSKLVERTDSTEYFMHIYQ